MKKLIFIALLFFSTTLFAQQQSTGAFTIVTSDTTDLPIPAKGLYIGVSGDVKVTMVNSDSAIVFKSVPIGILPIHVKKVYKTGTTATNLVGLKNN